MLFNTFIRVLLDSFYYYNINNIEKLMNKKIKENINFFYIYIRLTKF